MNKENNIKKQKRKLEIKELAQIATEKINENKILNETISIFQSQINLIKKILEKKSKINTDDSQGANNTTLNSTTGEIKINENNNQLNINSIIKNDFISYYEQLKQLVESSKEVNQKLIQKYETNNGIIFDETSLSKMDLNKYRIDNFLLDYEIHQKNDIIKKLIENVTNSKRHTIFREIKRETETNRIEGTNYLDSDNLYLQRDLQIESKSYNKCINNFHKKEKNIKKLKEILQSLKEYINFFEEEGKKVNKDNKDVGNKNLIFDKKKKDIKTSNFFSFSPKKKSINKKNNNNNNNDFNSFAVDDLGKKYQFGGDSLMINEEEDDEDIDIKDQTFFPQNNNLESLFFSEKNLRVSNQEKEKKKKVKQKFNFLTLDELFDLDNEEGEKEVIIQDELHSDDEVVFEKKIKNKNRICTDYLAQIKKQVPDLYFNQIEFNKKKVMNEADLYSLQRREYNKQNIDQNIKTMKKKIKIMKRRINVNEQKLKALIDFDKKAKEQYKVLKPIKVLSSMKDYNISFMKKEFYNYRTRKDIKSDVIDEVDEKTYKSELKNKNNYDKYKDEDDKFDFDDDDYSDKMRSRNNKYGKNNNNITMTHINDEENNNNLKKYSENDDDDNKAKSK